MGGYGFVFGVKFIGRGFEHFSWDGGKLLIVGRSLRLDSVFLGGLDFLLDVFFGESTLNDLIWVITHPFIYLNLYDNANVF